MKKRSCSFLTVAGISVLLCAFSYGIIKSGDIPALEILADFGGRIVRGACVCAGSGQDGSAIVAELLGGQLYWEGLTDAERQKKALVENRATAVLADDGVLSGESEKIPGDIEEISGDKETDSAQEKAVFGGGAKGQGSAVVNKLKSTMDTAYLWNKFYIVDSTTSVTKKLFPVKELLTRDMTINKQGKKKQILIYHTHGASECFSDSHAGKTEESVVGIGDALAAELEALGYGVIHDRTQYDRIGGSLDRSLAYNKSLEGVQKQLKENPDVKVTIDLHRDSVGKGKHTYTVIDNKKTAIVMLFNGMSRTKSGPIAYLRNPNLMGNLAFSLQLKCKAMEYYDGFTKPIYLKGYRYNLHLMERSLLIEWGNENNTLEEAKNAAAPMAKVLDMVLTGQG